MFKVNHFVNSFISIESDNSIFTCDPWIGKTTDNGWFSYPIKNCNQIEKKIFNSEFIYISHIHCDHLDFKTLKNFKNKNLTFIIKKFKNGILRKRLEKISKRIIELDSFKKKKLNKDFTIAIIPQIISNTNNLPDNIDYDLDTSIIIQGNKDKTIFFNNVDNPINIEVLKKVNFFVKKTFKRKIDIFCCALGAASEFPQCFLNLNRSKEKKRIIQESLNKIEKFLKYLKPKVFFAAGGTYKIYGKFYQLNKFIAQPTFKEIFNKTLKLKTKVIDLIGGGSIKLLKNEIQEINPPNKLKVNYHNSFMKKIKDINYYYCTNKSKINLKKLDIDFENAKKNYFRILNYKKNISSKWSINFKIHDSIEINKNCLIDKKKSKILKTYNLKNFFNNQKIIYKMDCHIEYKLFKSLLNGKFPWNTSLSGSTIMYKRNPNIFNIDMIFSLNFLRS
jgi:hypothetical protein